MDGMMMGNMGGMMMGDIGGMMMGDMGGMIARSPFLSCTLPGVRPF